MISRALALVLAPGLVASAAPPEAEAVCEGLYTQEQCGTISATQLNGRGQEKYEAGDYFGAIELWKQAILLLPESKRSKLRVPLAHAHRGAYEVTADEVHLHEARDLFTQQLDTLEPDDPVRGEIEAEVAEIDVELEALAEDTERREAEREEKIRQEEIAVREQTVRELEAKQTRKLRNLYLGIGGSLVGVGLGSLSAMAVNLAYGARTDREGEAAAMDPMSNQQTYTGLIDRGRAYNRAAWTTGVIGGVLVGSGLALLVVGITKSSKVKALEAPNETARLRPTVGGLVLQF